MTQCELITILRKEDGFKAGEICSALGVSRSGYYAALIRPPSLRALENEAIAASAREIHADRHTKAYGSPRMTAELRDRGVAASENRVARIMRDEGIRAAPKRSYRPKTTVQDADGSNRIAPNLLAETGKPDAPGQALVTDITYVATREGWLYLAVVLDLFSRCVIGWSISASLATPLAISALRRAMKGGVIGIAPGCIYHSDRGCQYTSHQHLTELTQNHLVPSMSAAGYCYDNATCESFFATLKNEAFPDDQVFDTQQGARLAIFDYIETFYNRRRKHSSLGYKSPQQFLAQHAFSMN
jgi:transposase InsO family protein